MASATIGTIRPSLPAKRGRLGDLANLCYKALADVEFCDGLRLLTIAAGSLGAPGANQTATSFHLTA